MMLIGTLCSLCTSPLDRECSMLDARTIISVIPYAAEYEMSRYAYSCTEHAIYRVTMLSGRIYFLTECCGRTGKGTKCTLTVRIAERVCHLTHIDISIFVLRVKHVHMFLRSITVILDNVHVIRYFDSFYPVIIRVT